MSYETAKSYQGNALRWQSYNRALLMRGPNGRRIAFGAEGKLMDITHAHWAVVLISRDGTAWTLADEMTLEEARAMVALESESGEIGPSERMEIRDTREVTP